MQTNISSEFSNFLVKPKNKKSLDLSESSLLECLSKKIDIAQRTSPKCGKQYLSLIKAIKAVEDASNTIIGTMQINEEFWSYFIPYLESTNLAASSINTICSQIKALLSWAAKYGAHIDETYTCFKLPQYHKIHVALTPDDVSRIYHLNIEDMKIRKDHKEQLIKVRDLFCLCCNIGLRYSDAIRLRPEHFKDGVITILQQKTKRFARIDINRMCIHKDMTHNILEKYGYSAPTGIDLSNYDKYLHEICHMCKFEDRLHQESILGGVVITKERVKADMISSHTGRRTFVVNAALRGIPYTDIMAATGHHTFSAFQKYLCY